MPSKEELIKATNEFFGGEYEVTEGSVIPNVDDIGFGKNARALDLAMLFIDVKESTKIVDNLRRVTAARMYKSFLYGVAQIARMNGGELRSFNGDGVLVAFNGESRRTNAAKASLQMTWFVRDVLRPKMEQYFEKKQELKDMDFDFGIGIDEGRVLVIRGGIRGENNSDLVWVGNATNYAVKLAALSKDGYNVYISGNVYKHMDKSSKYGGNPEKDMWESRIWKDMGDIRIYRSNWQWKIK